MEILRLDPIIYTPIFPYQGTKVVNTKRIFVSKTINHHSLLHFQSNQHMSIKKSQVLAQIA